MSSNVLLKCLTIEKYLYCMIMCLMIGQCMSNCSMFHQMIDCIAIIMTINHRCAKDSFGQRDGRMVQGARPHDPRHVSKGKISNQA